MINSKMYDLGKSPSKIRELFEYGKNRKREIGEDKVFDFSIGNPSVASPDVVNETLIKLITNTEPTLLHGYTSATGDLTVRQKIAEYLNNTYGTNHKAEYIYLTVGAAASLTISLNALINPGDEVIVFAPYFPEYKVFVEKAGGILKEVLPDPETFEPNLIDLENKISAKTKAVIINSPNNPTGVVISEETIIKISELLNKKSLEYNGIIYLLSDEPYRELVYEGVTPFITKYYDNTIISYSFSKSLSLPGERIGYLLVSEKCIYKDEVFTAICGAGRALGFVCAPALFQYMIPSCLGVTSDINVYRENRDKLYKHLTKLGYEVLKPSGAFYMFVKALEDDATKFMEKAKKHELLLVPSDSFGYPGYVRISYCVSPKMIDASLTAFEKLYKEYK